MSRKPRSLSNLQRSKPKRSPYERVLIVCEGRKTEPNYFRSMIIDLRLNTANVEVDGDSDSTPRSVVTHAKERYFEDKRQNGPEKCFDKVYCVLDKDEHPTYDGALNTIRTLAPKGVFHAITSVPCFELWLLLHFRFNSSPIVRTGQRSPGDNAEHELKKHLSTYEKGDKSIYNQIKHLTDEAIKNARRLAEAVKQVDTDNPSTRVHELVEYLRNLGK